MGPFPTAMRQLNFLIVGIDYFTKWVEAEALATIMKKNIRSFVWKNIVCRYGIPKVLVSYNGKQFDNAHSWESRTTTLSSPTHKPTSKLRP